MLPVTAGGWNTYPIFFSLTILIGATVPLALAYREGYLTKNLVVAVGWVVVAGVLGAKLYGSVERGFTFGSIWGELVAGYRAPGAILGGIAALSSVRLLFGIRGWRVADLLAPGVALGMVAFRTGCFLSGCCAGTRCDLPWAVRFPVNSVVWNRHAKAGLIDTEVYSLPVHPLQLYFGLWSLLVAVLLLRYRRNHPREGQVFLLYLALAGAGKFALENLRYGYAAHLQYAALASCALAGIAFFWRQPRAPTLGRPASVGGGGSH